MKKFFPFLLLLMIVSLTACQKNEAQPRLVYVNQLFDDQDVGVPPNSFEFFQFNYDYGIELKQIQLACDSVEIVKIEKDGKTDNHALKFSRGSEPAFVRKVFNYLPIQKKGVISFSFMVNDFESDKRSYINTNVLEQRHMGYLENDAYFEFITIRDNDVYWRDKEVVKEDIAVDTWYRVDLVFDVETRAATIYFDGAATSVTLPAGTQNVSEVRFDMPSEKGSSWLIDELRVYEADDVVSDKVINEDWKEYTDSAFYFGANFEAGRPSNYDYVAFLAAYNKVFSVVNTNKIYAENHVFELPTEIYKEKEQIMVPACAVAEALGAKTEWNAKSGRVKIKYRGKVLKAASNEYTLVDGTACMSLDRLLAFMGMTYTEQNDILWFGEPMVCEWELPEGLLTYGDRTLEEQLRVNLLTMLLFDRPSAEEIGEALGKHSTDNKHPRLMIDSFEQIKYGIKNDPQFKGIADNIIAEARSYVNAETVKYETHDGVRSSYAGAIMTYFPALSFAYRFSEEEDVEKYKDSIWRQIESLYEFPDFHGHQHNLSMGQTCHGLYFAYDWLYDEWTPEQRAKIEEVCKRNIFDPALLAYNSSIRYHVRDITYGGGNQPIINNGGIAVLALAMYDADPEYFADVIRGALRSTELGFMDFFPEGEWQEGISYWRYTMGFMPLIIKSFQTACGTDFGITDIPGVLETGFFPISMRGATNAFSFGDGQPESAIVGAMMFQAEQTGDKQLAEYRKNNMGSGSIIDLISWVYDTGDYNEGLAGFAHDVYAKTNATVIMKTGWDKNATAVAFHGGSNNDPHGHVDSGSFQFDMSGVRFAMDLPREDYNLRDRGHYNVARLNEFGKIHSAGHYYRQKGEGHNCVVANRQETNARIPAWPNSYDMKTAGTTTFIKTEFGENVSFALLDMTDLNDVFESAARRVTLDKVHNVIEIQDNIKAVKETDFLWSMHTYAVIDLSADKKTAILSQDGVSIMATILSNGGEVFEVLPAAFLEDYGTKVKPRFETPNTVYTQEDEYYLTHGKACDINMDARKLAVRAVTDHFELTVAFQPYEKTN